VVKKVSFADPPLFEDRVAFHFFGVDLVREKQRESLYIILLRKRDKRCDLRQISTETLGCDGGAAN